MKFENRFNNFYFLKIFLKWKVHFIAIFVLSVLLSAIFSSPKFIKPKYKSFAVLYPSNLIPYSTETATEQMLQIFRSDEIRDSIISTYNLVDYYGIDKNKPFHYTETIRKYQKNVNIRKTEFESILIEVLDVDPIRASEMVNSIISIFNRKVRNMHKEKAEEVLIISQRQLLQKEAQIDSVSFLLKKLSTDYKIIDYEAQAKEVTKGYLKTIDGTGASNVNNKAVEELKHNLESMGAEYVLLNNLLSGLIEQYIELKTDYEIALRDVEKHLTYTNVVSNPIPADKKSYPIRWLIVFFSTLSTMFISTLLIVFIENLKTESH